MFLLPEYSLSRLDVIHQLDALSLLRGLAAKSIKLIVTSPPYDEHRLYGGGWSFPFEAIARESYRVLDDGSVLVWVVGDMVRNGSETLTSMRQALYFVDVAGFRMHDTMIYQKAGSPFPESTRYMQTFEYMFVLSKGAPVTTNLLKGITKYGASTAGSARGRDGKIQKFKYDRVKPTKTLDNVWYIPGGYMKTTKDIDAYQHPAMFPEELARRHIMTWSNPGDTVLDYFAGSGTTLKMARNLNRRYIGGDINAEYVALARKRLAQPYTLSMFDRIEKPPVPVQRDLFATP